MTRKSLCLGAAVGAATLALLAWPGPAGADTQLGGYGASAKADALSVEVYDQVIPIPTSQVTDPQLDFGIAHAASTTDNGPLSRSVASYLWPGDVVGDGLDQLVPGAKYPVQVNSRYPATSTAPATNAAQVSDGNGMTTSASESSTAATTQGLGISGSSGNDLGKGLCQLLNPSGCPGTPTTPKLPVQVSSKISALATLDGARSTTKVTLGAHSITSTADTELGGVQLLGGIIALHGVHVTSTIVSNGTKATVTGSTTIGGVTVAGKTLGLDADGIDTAGSHVKIPTLPKTLTDLLGRIGIGFSYAPTTKTVQGAQGSFRSSGLVITVDTKLVHAALAPITGILSDQLSKIPGLDQISALVGLGPKIVYRVGDVQNSALASAGYSGGTSAPTGGTTSTGGATGGTSGSTGTGGTVGGTTPLSSGGGAATGTTGGPVAGTTTPVPTATGYDLPGLGSVPRLLLLGGLVLACVLGWAFRALGVYLLGDAGSCSFGLSTGVPDLRKVS